MASVKLPGRKPKNTYEYLQQQGPANQPGTRDVFETQQLERSRLDKPKSRVPFRILAGFIFLFTLFLSWLAWSAGQFFVHAASHYNTKGLAATKGDGFSHYWWSCTLLKFLITWGIAAATAAISYSAFERNRKVQSAMSDPSDVNQHEDDQHIATPHEVFAKFDIFPDVGAHSSVSGNSIVSHAMLVNKGIKKIPFAKWADEDTDEYLEGEMITDDNGDPVTEMVPFIDEKFGDALFTASGITHKSLRVKFNPSDIAYNPLGKDGEPLSRDKLVPPKGAKYAYNTWADVINHEWEFPLYEPQRPAGVYIVDVAPINTMILAITRGGKGQTVIEPTLDIWTRQINPDNIFANDPKGELLVKNYVRATMRGFQVMQFNLINAEKTDIYNPLGIAADAAREGDFIRTAQYVEDIGGVFFPSDGGDDPVWANSANNAFKRACYGLIDYYLDEERRLRIFALASGMDPKVLDTKLDAMWGRVTLYNCYQLFVQMSARKKKSPLTLLKEQGNANGEAIEPDSSEYKDAEKLEDLWDGEDQASMLDLYFAATDVLPRNGSRTLVGNAHNALKSMAGSEKMLASVYGIAITGMSFFTDPTVSRLTSGTPSQNVDLGGLSFPRRIGVRFDQNFVKKYSVIGLQCQWEAFSDENFTQSLGKNFKHDDIVSAEGWARYAPEGIFPQNDVWLRLDLVESQTQMLNRSFYFQFRKDYQASFKGRYYITDPISGEKIVKNGTLAELVKEGDEFIPRHSTFKQPRITSVKPELSESVTVEDDVPTSIIISTMVRYSEQPKMIFVVTPPHLMKYAKLILILISQMVNMNFSASYMTKPSQKPLLKTRYMLDELGNLQSEGKGISNFQTYLSIGLGQDQQFTLILQTLQQLRDVYGESVDKIVQGNVSNIVYLKSNDDSMLETLSKISGTRHVTRRDGKTITHNANQMFNQNEGHISYNINTQSEPVISLNDMLFINERQSILFRAGDAVVWNRNETILPMSWRLFKTTITHPGHNYSLQTIPTLSTAKEFDLRGNQPNFELMLDRRLLQAKYVDDAKRAYDIAYDVPEDNHDDYISRLDPDVYADEIMRIIDSLAGLSQAGMPGVAEVDDENESLAYMGEDDDYVSDGMTDDEDVKSEMRKAEELDKIRSVKKFARQTISIDQLVSADDVPLQQLDKVLSEAFLKTKKDFVQDRRNFTVVDNELYGTGEWAQCLFVSEQGTTKELEAIEDGSRNPDSRLFSNANSEDYKEFGARPLFHPDFYRYLASLDNWLGIANGKFDAVMAHEMQASEDASDLQTMF